MRHVINIRHRKMDKNEQGLKTPTLQAMAKAILAKLERPEKARLSFNSNQTQLQLHPGGIDAGWFVAYARYQYLTGRSSQTATWRHLRASRQYMRAFRKSKAHHLAWLQQMAEADESILSRNLPGYSGAKLRRAAAELAEQLGDYARTPRPLSFCSMPAAWFAAFSYCYYTNPDDSSWMQDSQRELHLIKFAETMAQHQEWLASMASMDLIALADNPMGLGGAKVRSLAAKALKSLEEGGGRRAGRNFAVGGVDAAWLASRAYGEHAYGIHTHKRETRWQNAARSQEYVNIYRTADTFQLLDWLEQVMTMPPALLGENDIGLPPAEAVSMAAIVWGGLQDAFWKYMRTYY